MALTAIRIQDFAIVRSLDLQLDPGLTVLTGETGAGKSIVVDALTLALGARAETDWIRHDADRAEVSASFDISGNEDARGWLEEQDLSANGGEVLIRRVSYRDKASRAFINDRPVTAQSLRQLGALLVDIHGQHEHQSLLRRDSQRQILDDYAGISERVAALTAIQQRYQTVTGRIDELSQCSRDREARVELLRFQVEELTQLETDGRGFAEIEQEHARLAHATELAAGMRAAVHELYDAETGAVNSTLGRCLQSLTELSEYEPALAEVSELLNGALVQTEEAAGRLHQLADRVELDPQRLETIQRQLSTWVDLARKHRCRPEELPEVLAGLQRELTDLDEAGVSIDELKRQKTALRADYDDRARELTRQRTEAATQLSAAISAQMAELGMGGGRFEVTIDTESEGEPSRHGRDRIDYLVSTNPGQPPKFLTRVASGGELSRISLAISVITAAVGRVPTMIFDEVDVGIGGGVAEIVGQRLRELAARRQVLCITHLPQVAAQGQQHLSVRKRSGDELAVTISALVADERIDEVARMLGGVEITDQTVAHAADMLQRAAS